MRSPFSFDGELRRPAYALASTAVFFTQHLLVFLVFAISGATLRPQWWFWVNPLRALVFGQFDKIALAQHPVPPWVLLSAMVATLVIDWMLVALAFRRAQNARGYAGLAALAVAPAIQIVVFVWLSVAPRLPNFHDEADAIGGTPAVRTAVLGMLAGAALSVGAVAVSTLVLGLYGYGLFIASPLVVGLTTAYLGNRTTDLGIVRTTLLVFGALVVGGMALLGLAFEGAFCLILAAPLAGAMGFVGGLLGRALARRSPRRRGATLTSVAVVPLVLLGEVLLPPKAGFQSVESVEVAAPPAAVWDAVVHMGPIPNPPAAPFRWGLAYPVRGEILGTGVGAIRRGVFSTGVAYEKVTEWEPGRKLSFIVLSDPPMMREFSPYRHVNAPHVRGYFKTLDARFTITPLANGKTRLSLATRHELDLEPALYWAPIAEWATHANKMRVLEHFRQQAEAANGASPKHRE